MEQLLSTKIYIPAPHPDIIPRPSLIKRLSESLHCKLALISAPDGIRKTTLVSEWVTSCERPGVWLGALDEGDNDPTHFLANLIAALQTIAADIGNGVLGMLQSTQPPPAEAILTSLINEFAATKVRIIFVLNDYHLIEAQPIHDALIFLLEDIPQQIAIALLGLGAFNFARAKYKSSIKLTEQVLEIYDALPRPN